MALKDWKKIRENPIAWIKKGSEKYITIYNSREERKDYMLVIQFEGFPTPDTLGGSIVKHFKTKSQALKFAKQYMRTH